MIQSTLELHPFLADEPPRSPSWLPTIVPTKAKVLHLFQVTAICALKAALLAGHRRVMLQAPTGAGKTVIAAEIVRAALAKGKRVVFVVNALSLVEQTVNKFWAEGIQAIGVIQARHEMTDSRQPVQVCSVQTLSRRCLPQADLVIIDEAHNIHKIYAKWMALPEWQAIPFIGLSATPYAKGLGRLYTSLVRACSTQALIDQGFLSPFRVYAPGKAPDLSGVRTVAGEYDQGQLSEAMDKKNLVADAVEMWLKHADNRPTLCYAVDCAHARHLHEQFQAAGVPSAYMDAHTEMEERRRIADGFAAGEIRVVNNVGVLTTGIDWDVRCISLCRPTKSEILFQQIIGRGLRTAPGKEYALILDHSTTHESLGLVTDVEARNTDLDDGKARKSSARDKKDIGAQACPSCKVMKPAGISLCPLCGFKAQRQNKVGHRQGDLVPLRGQGVTYSQDEKRAFYAGLLGYLGKTSFKPGWAAMQYKEKFGVWPRGMDNVSARDPDRAVLGWIRSRQIAYARRRLTHGKEVADAHA